MAPVTARERSTETRRPLPGSEAHQRPTTKAKKCVNPCARLSRSVTLALADRLDRLGGLMHAGVRIAQLRAAAGRGLSGFPGWAAGVRS